MIVVRTGANNRHHCQDAYFEETSSRRSQALSSPFYLTSRLAEHKELLFQIFRFLYFHYLPDTQFSHFAKNSGRVNYYLGACCQFLPLCNLPLYHYNPVQILHTGVGICEVFHAFHFQPMIYLSHYMGGTCNDTRDSFCEAYLHRYTQFYNRRMTTSNLK